MQIARLVLASCVALDLDLPNVWLMHVGPPGGGKTEIYVEIANAYHPHVETADLSEAGLISMEKKTKGQGVLKRLGAKGVWTIADFSSITSLREETRAKIASALRHIYDQKWSRDMKGQMEPWTGKCAVIAACTNAIEKFHKLQGELGDRFIQVRSARVSAVELHNKAREQQRHRQQVKDQLHEAGTQMLLAHNGLPQMSDEVSEQIAGLADLCGSARKPIGRDYQGKIFEVLETESGGRLYQQFSAVAQADAALQGHHSITDSQLALLFRVAIDSAPIGRALVLKRLLTPQVPELGWADLFSTGEFEWKMQLTRSLEELEITGLVVKEAKYRASERALVLAIPAFTWS